MDHAQKLAKQQTPTDPFYAPQRTQIRTTSFQLLCIPFIFSVQAVLMSKGIVRTVQFALRPLDGNTESS
ncbi:hypothetical protein K505DRAFT_45830 [Melanomma pulvis-pyrius CBS 109.77]|uniref:Uncharacterized protein n=1 Tax=Melanomma pulvis-pyrius CBS 109.77 TaxID=1314802 RepID=A0A6A6XAZ6_9PLEO|nr:hypothetical protein K505DRAFT_45830 [Melanomma pulvis-pyrius CBS 109.77]